jgi:hypothetical protein
MTRGPSPYGCYLSVVAVARNDDHGGNLLERMQLFVSGLADQCRKYVIDAELILVEWNPPTDRPDLAHVLHWPSRTPLRYRIVRVPPNVHEQFEHASGLPLFQMIAKNVGIRRAEGRFVLATNIDILFNDALMSHLASHPLIENTVYRIDRYDIPSDWPANMPTEQILAKAPEVVVRVNRKLGSSHEETGKFHRVHKDPSLKVMLRELLSDLGLRGPTTVKRLHTNACGDFTMMARRHWFDLRGYAQWPMYSMHLDSVLLQAAVLNGLNEEVLPDPMRIYHLEHAAGSGFTPETEHKLNDRLKQSGVPRMSDREYLDLAVAMRAGRKPLIVNGEDWGLRDASLTEVVPA